MNLNMLDVVSIFLFNMAITGPVLYALFYFLGQFASFANHATSIIASPDLKVRHIDTMGKYVANYWPKLLVRFLANTIAVIVLAILPKVFFPSFDLDIRIQGLSVFLAVVLKCALSCACGLMADVILKKVQDVAKSKGVDLSATIPAAPGQTVVTTKDEVDKATGRGAGT